MNDVRTGLGFDIHAFTEGEFIWLGGVKIPHNQGVLAHSDGDVALHALTDALLGAIGLGDIGDHFPPSDEQWKNAASVQFVEYAVSMIKKRDYRIANIDIAIIAEAPKIAPYRAKMQNAMAQMLNIETDRVSIKATTNEKLGALGRKEGIAAMAVATLIR